MWRFPPVVQPLTLLYTNFDGKGTPFGFCIPPFEKWYLSHIPSLELCNPFDCCKCNVFEICINHKTRTFYRYFCSHKMNLLALLGLFTDRNDSFPYPFIYFNCIVKSLLFYTPEAFKRYPFYAEPPCICHYRESP